MACCYFCKFSCHCRCHWYQDPIYGGDSNAGQEILIVKKDEKSKEPRNPHYTKLLKEIEELHEKKSHDYAKDSNVFSNFDYANSVAEPFQGIHKIFATLVGVKFARLAELLYKNPNGDSKVPKHESIEDSAKDATNYVAIWASRIIRDLESGLKMDAFYNGAQWKVESLDNETRGLRTKFVKGEDRKPGVIGIEPLRTSLSHTPVPTLQQSSSGHFTHSGANCTLGISGCNCALANQRRIFKHRLATRKNRRVTRKRKV